MTESTGEKTYSFIRLDGEVAECKMRFSFFPVEFELDPTESLLNQGQLHMEIIGAKNLPAADSGGTSDPYVLVLLDGEKVFKTKTLKKELNPTFKEGFDIPIVCSVLIYAIQTPLAIKNKV